jgi:hypothetical protein
VTKTKKQVDGDTGNANTFKNKRVITIATFVSTSKPPAIILNCIVFVGESVRLIFKMFTVLTTANRN